MATEKIESNQDELIETLVGAAGASDPMQDGVQVTRLSERDSRCFVGILDSDKEPSPELVRAREKYQRLIVSSTNKVSASE